MNAEHDVRLFPFLALRTPPELFSEQKPHRWEKFVYQTHASFHSRLISHAKECLEGVYWQKDASRSFRFCASHDKHEMPGPKHCCFETWLLLVYSLERCHVLPKWMKRQYHFIPESLSLVRCRFCLTGHSGSHLNFLLGVFFCFSCFSCFQFDSNFLCVSTSRNKT